MKISPAGIFLIVLAAERGLELLISRRNEIRMRKLGGREYGAAFTRLLISFHLLWLVSFAVEATIRRAGLLLPPAALIFVFLFLQGGRYWCIFMLGQHWNTKIIALRGAKLVRSGPYRFIKHPNYMVVLLELFVYPALFGCWTTSLLFGSLNLFVLKKRIRQEEAALGMIGG